jgi:hypothetical protein
MKKMILIMVFGALLFCTGCFEFFKAKESPPYRPDMTPGLNDPNNVLAAKVKMLESQLAAEVEKNKDKLKNELIKDKQHFYRRYEILLALGIAGGFIAAILLKSRLTGLAATIGCGAGIAVIELLKMELPSWLQAGLALGGLAAAAYGVYAVLMVNKAFTENLTKVPALQSAVTKKITSRFMKIENNKNGVIV